MYAQERWIPSCYFSDVDADYGHGGEENNCQPTSKCKFVSHTNSYMSLQQATFTMPNSAMLFKGFHRLMEIKLILCAMYKYT